MAGRPVEFVFLSRGRIELFTGSTVEAATLVSRKVTMKITVWATLCLVVASAGLPVEGADPSSSVVGLPLIGAEAVEFLSTAKVVGEPESFDEVAITGPLRVTLSDGARTLRAVFKDEDTLYPEFRYGDGREVERAKDSYKHEIAAFELDTMLGLGLVPPCVERKIGSRKGSLCLWVERSMTEDRRREDGLDPPDPVQFKAQMREVRLFQQLIADLDYSNIRNLVIDTNFQVYKVDSSMAYYPDPELLPELNSAHVSRRFLRALETLDKKEMNERLNRWLLKVQRGDLWARRNRILKRADKLIAEYGEEEVLY